MLETIDIKKANPPIPGPMLVNKEADKPEEVCFKLENLKKFNVIVGKNNSGKTRFFESVVERYEKDPLVVAYIPANQVNPQDDHFKTSATSSTLIATLSLLLKLSLIHI